VFDHVTIRASERKVSERFYDTVLEGIGLERSHSGEHYTEWGDFSLGQASGEKPVTHRLHLAFLAPSRGHVDEFWRVGTSAGHRDDGAPGPRPQYSPDYYGSFLLDPDGNSAEAVHHDKQHRGPIDHLWLRVRDLARAREFYKLLAPQTGFGNEHDRPDRVTFAGADGSFTLVEGKRPSTCTSRSRRARTTSSMRSTAQRSRPATATTARPASGPNTTPATTARSCSIPIAQAS
jgi:catechol 2,3-dioxygenase-like lactoylglutathione lyase family enzyme